MEKEKQERILAVVLAGGSGKRMGSRTKKQYILIDGKPVIYYSLKTFQDSFADEIVLVVSPGDIEYCRKEIVEKYGFSKVSHIVEGGKERYHSVAAGLNSVTDFDYVFIHDGARPMVSAEILDRALTGVRQYGACVAGVPVKDTIKIVDEEGKITATPNRNYMWMVQTPQVFSCSLIKEAYNELLNKEQELVSAGVAVTDDAMVVETLTGHPVRLVEGSYRNIKITTLEDIPLAENYLRQD